MNFYIVVTIAALAFYVLLFAKAIPGERKNTRLFLLIYLAASALWAATGFVAHANYFPEQVSLLGTILPLAGLWVVVAYGQLVCAFIGRRVAVWTGLGYAFITTMVVLAALGYMHDSAQFAGVAGVNMVFNPWQYALIAGVALFAALPIIYLLQRYRSLSDLQMRNQALYVIVGAFLAAAASLLAALLALVFVNGAAVRFTMGAFSLRIDNTEMRPSEVAQRIVEGLRLAGEGSQGAEMPGG